MIDYLIRSPVANLPLERQNGRVVFRLKGVFYPRSAFLISSPNAISFIFPLQLSFGIVYHHCNHPASHDGALKHAHRRHAQRRVIDLRKYSASSSASVVIVSSAILSTRSGKPSSFALFSRSFVARLSGLPASKTTRASPPSARINFSYS